MAKTVVVSAAGNRPETTYTLPSTITIDFDRD
eukprot:SAG11_NODE_52087_length_107_cov_915.375000_1_plen_31_part_10